MNGPADVTVAINVVLASRVLPAGAKLLFLKTAYLAQGPRGCELRPRDMADALGGDPETVEVYWRRLVRSGLLRRGTERGLKRSLYLTFPWELRPGTQKPTIGEYRAAAVLLDLRLRAAGVWTKSRTPVRESPAPTPNPDAETPPPQPRTRVRESTASIPNPDSDFAGRIPNRGAGWGEGGSSVLKSVTLTPSSTSRTEEEHRPSLEKAPHAPREKSRDDRDGGAVRSEREGTKETTEQQSLPLLSKLEGNPDAPVVTTELKRAQFRAAAREARERREAAG